MNEPEEQKRLVIEAYHEAAHAVACHLLHKRFKYVTIKSDGEKLGKIIYPPKSTKKYPSEKERKVFGRDVKVFIAGPIAEGILSGKTNFEDVFSLLNSGDKHKIDDILWKISFDDTKLLIYAPRNWQAVTRLAYHLLSEETINHQTAAKLIKQSLEDYDNGLRREISALHYTHYSLYQKQVSDARAKFRERMKAVHKDLRKE
ncbi:MAG: hypothetical protein ABH852_05520 [Methanobacteriota archaeon]